jgi:glyoxylase-like metal-dependent hydrolase (beta-lactamase superfamily II)
MSRPVVQLVIVARRALVLTAIVAAGVAAGRIGSAQAPVDFDAVDVRAFHVQGSVHMLVGAGGNVTVQVGDDGVLVVDTQYAQMVPKLLDAIRRLAGDRPIRYVVNTHVHGDHTGGNEAFHEAGQAIVAGNFAREDRDSGAAIIAHENVLLRMSVTPEGETPIPAGALPSETFFGDEDQLFFNGEAIRLVHMPAAHTDGDILAFFRKSDVVSAGDVYVTTAYPFIDRARGGTIGGVLDGLNRIIAITVPRDKQEGGTMVIPGHGRISDEADVVEYRDMLTIIRDRVQEMVDRRMTLEQVQAARPTSDYDGRYGSSEGFWTTDRFVEAVFATLQPGGRP